MSFYINTPKTTTWLRGFKRRKCVSRKLYKEMMPLVLFNQVFVLLPCMTLVAWYGHGFYGNAIPVMNPGSFTKIILLLMYSSLGHDIVFYFGHRYILHSRWGLPIFRHDIHHSTKADVALSAVYMHPSDFMLEIIAPYLLPYVLITATHGNVLLDIFIAPLGAIGGVYEHSGYNFLPNIRLFDTYYHFSHHARWNVSFSDGVGSTNMMDTLFDTAANRNVKCL
eukprot:CFRG2176T1